MVFQCTNMINILQPNILDGHLDFISFCTVVKNTALFTGRACAKAVLGPLHTPCDGCIKKKKDQETASAKKKIEKLEPFASGNVKLYSCCGKQYGRSSEI